MIWSVDTELDELLNEARAASAVSADQSKLPTKDLATIISKAKKAQQNAENDKQRIQAIVKKLLVRTFPLVTYSIMNVM
jgi:THO complex subunit 2